MDAKVKNRYGFQSDNIELKTNDSSNPVKSFSVYTTIEDFFPTLTADELSKAPMLLIDRYEIDFLRVKRVPTIENSVTIQNRGKKNLEIRYVQSNCSCVLTMLDKKTLKPRETATLSIKFISEGRSGTQNKAMTIYSNDPRNPVQRVTITGYIED